MVNIISFAVIAAVVGLAARYVYKAKKRGVKCVGCPGGCPSNGSCGGCSCDCH